MDLRVSASEAKARLAEYLNRVRYSGDRVWIHRRGQVVAVLVSPESLGASSATTPYAAEATPAYAASGAADVAGSRRKRPWNREELQQAIREGKVHPVMRVFGAWADDPSTEEIAQQIYTNRALAVSRRVRL